MRTSAPGLLPLLRSQVQGDLLALLFLHPEEELSLTEAARRIDASIRSVHHETNRLVQAGLLNERRQGNNRLVRAAVDSLLARPLTELLALTFGPLPVLTRQLAGVAGVDQAYIYGSWAARYCGELGPPPADVDVLVVGDADLDLLHERAATSQLQLGREVNVRRVRSDRWNAPEPWDPFLTSVRSRPLVQLDLEPTRPASLPTTSGTGTCSGLAR